MMTMLNLIICTVLLTVSVSCEDYSVLEKNNITFKVFADGSYYVEDNNIPVLHPGLFAGINNIKVLRLYNSKIEEIQLGTFANLAQLKVLEICQNKLRKIEAGVFGSLPLLTKLDLSENDISFIDPYVFDNLSNLNFINLANNKLSRLDVNWFAKTPTVKSVYLSYNLLKKIPANAFGGIKTTSKSRLNVFIDSNNIKEIDERAFEGIKYAGVISVNNNKLDQFNGSCLKEVQVEEFVLNANNIRCLKEKDFDKIFVAELTEIAGNPWEEKCLDKIMEWAKEHGKQVQTDIA